MEREVEAASDSQKELTAFLDQANNSRLRNEVCALPATCRERILFNQLDAASSMWTVAIPTARTAMTPHELREVAAGYFFLPSLCLALVVGCQIILPSTEHNPVIVDLYAVPLGNTVPRDELKDLVPDAELSFPAFNVVTGSYDPRSLKSTLLEFKTMRHTTAGAHPRVTRGTVRGSFTAPIFARRHTTAGAHPRVTRGTVRGSFTAPIFARRHTTAGAHPRVTRGTVRGSFTAPIFARRHTTAGAHPRVTRGTVRGSFTATIFARRSALHAWQDSRHDAHGIALLGECYAEARGCQKRAVSSGAEGAVSMFANDYQGGPAFEVLSPQGSNPLANWKISGPGAKATKKVYEKAVKGYAFSCQGGHGFKMQFPKDERKGMVLLQPYLGLQVYILGGQPFSLELSVTTADSTRRRLFLSSSFQEAKATALHAQVPLQALQRDCWLNLAFNVASLVGDCFGGQPFRSLDLMILGGAFKLRRIFTLKQPPPDTVTQRPALDAMPLPTALNYPIGVEHVTQVLDTLAQCGSAANMVHLNGKHDHGEAAGSLQLGIQGEASPPAKRGAAQRRAHSGSRIASPGSGTSDSRIPGSPSRTGSRHGPGHHVPAGNGDPHDGRRVQSAALQRAGSPGQAGAGLVPLEAGPQPGARKVASAASGNAIRGRNSGLGRVGAQRPQPARVHLGLQVNGSHGSASEQPALPPPSPALDRPPMSPTRMSNRRSSLPPGSNGALVGPSSPKRSPKPTERVRASNSFSGNSSPIHQVEGGLPGVVGMSADKRGAGMEPWATESVRVSGSVNFSKYSANGRYSDGDGAPLSPSASGRKFWNDTSRLRAEDVPLRRQADHISHSSMSRSTLGGSPGPSSPYGGRVPPLSPSPGPPGDRSLSGLKSVPAARTLNLSMDGPIASDQPPSFSGKSNPAPPSISGAIPPLGFGGPSLEPPAPLASTSAATWCPSIAEHPGKELELPSPVRCSNSSNRIELEAMAAPERLEAPAQRSFQQLGALVEEVGVRMADADWLMSESGVLRASVASSAREVEDDEELGSGSPPNEAAERLGRKTLSVSVDTEEADVLLGTIMPVPPSGGGDSPGRPPDQEAAAQASQPWGPGEPSGESHSKDRYAGRHDFMEAATDEYGLCAAPRAGRRGDQLLLSEDGYGSRIVTQPRAFTPPVVTPSQVFDSPSKGLADTSFASSHGAARAEAGDAVDQSVEYRDLIYDPILNCYYDTKSNQYFSVK
eukprot:jgi/Tetstr1/458577/TSEL_044980.t1